MSELNELKDYLIELGASKVGFADVNGLANEFVDLPNGISLVLKLPKETITLTGDDLEVFNKMLAMLDEVEDVQNVYHNVEL